MQAQKPINMISSVVLHPVQPCYMQLHQKSYCSITEAVCSTQYTNDNR